MSSFSKGDREGCRRRVGDEEAARRPRSITAAQWGYQLAEERKRLGFMQAGLAEITRTRPARSKRSRVNVIPLTREVWNRLGTWRSPTFQRTKMRRR